MFRNLVILFLCLVAVSASGEFSILNAPDSLDFKGNEKLESESVGDVVSASLGYWVDDGTKWSGLYVNDPFNTPKSAVVVLIKGVDHINLNTKAKTYPMSGSSSEESLNAVSSEMESANLLVANMDFSQLNDALVTFTDVFGEAPSQVAPIKATNSLKPDLHSEDKEFLTQIAYISEVAEKYTVATQHPTLLTMSLSLTAIGKAHGDKSAAKTEAQKLVSNVLEDLSEALKTTSNGETLLVVIAENAELNRAKRDVVDADAAKTLNLATYYSEDYPVIFNIILWFMVVFGMSLLAICYAIGSMDPGRDSIIYRMTSTRMKKDN